MIKEASKFGENHITYPESIMELLYKAGELTRSEINTPIEMEVTLDQFISNIGYGKCVASDRDPFKHVLTFQRSPGNVSLRGVFDKSRVPRSCPMDSPGRAALYFETWSGKFEYIEGKMQCSGRNNVNFQLRVLRRNVDHHGDALSDNYRPTQALNSRVVNYYRV